MSGRDQTLAFPSIDSRVENELNALSQCGEDGQAIAESLKAVIACMREVREPISEMLAMINDASTPLSGQEVTAARPAVAKMIAAFRDSNPNVRSAIANARSDDQFLSCVLLTVSQIEHFQDELESSVARIERFVAQRREEGA